MANYLATRNEILERKDAMCARLLDTLGRMDLDRRLLIKDKIDVLLERRDSSKDDNALAQLKLDRRRQIILQREAYN